MQFIKEYTNANGVDAVIYDTKVTEVVGTEHAFCIVSKCNQQRTVLKFERDEFKAIVEEFQRHPPVTINGVVVVGPAWLVRWVDYWRRRHATRQLQRIGSI